MFMSGNVASWKYYNFLKKIFKRPLKVYSLRFYERTILYKMNFDLSNENNYCHNIK